MAKSETFLEGYRHVALGDVQSTNDIASEYFSNGDPGKLWITAERQLGGKGSRGRNWVSVRGNLYASLLLRMNLAPGKLANLTFVASLALYDALATYIASDRLALKWPNDILVNGAKISGILLESHIRQNQDAGVIIGMGVNCGSHPTDTRYKATSLSEQGVKILPLELFQNLTRSFEKHLNIWDNGTRFDIIRQMWLERAKGIGEHIAVKSPKQKLGGIFEDIDEQGLLILRTGDNVRHCISTADIFFSNHNQKSA